MLWCFRYRRSNSGVSPFVFFFLFQNWNNVNVCCVMYVFPFQSSSSLLLLLLLLIVIIFLIVVFSPYTKVLKISNASVFVSIISHKTNENRLSHSVGALARLFFILHAARFFYVLGIHLDLFVHHKDLPVELHAQR